MPASVKDRDAGRKISPPPLKVRGWHRRWKRLLGAGGGAAGVKLSGRSGRPGLSKIAWQEIDRRAERMHILLFWFIPR